MESWLINARFPSDLKERTEKFLAKVNADPYKMGKVSKNDVLVIALRLFLDREEQGEEG